jgi:hypothetical protein
VKALSLWQPWAQLIAVGAKQVETRNWRPPATLGQVVICSAQRSLNLAKDVPDSAARGRIGYALDVAGFVGGAGLWYGKALCLVSIASVCASESLRRTLSDDELAFGDYRDGRFGWVLTNLRPFRLPFPVCGRQGIFDVPDYLVAEALR